jgi:hypothetical protein
MTDVITGVLQTLAGPPFAVAQGEWDEARAQASGYAKHDAVSWNGRLWISRLDSNSVEPAVDEDGTPTAPTALAWTMQWDPTDALNQASDDLVSQASVSASVAAAAASTATTNAGLATTAATNTAADRVQTGLDRTQTGQDRAAIATAASNAAAAAAAAAVSEATALQAATNQGFIADTLTQLNTNTTALLGSVIADGANNGTYARSTRNNPATSWVKVSDVTITSLDSRAVALETMLQKPLGPDSVAFVDESGNTGLSFDVARINHPDTNAMRDVVDVLRPLKDVLQDADYSDDGLALTDEQGNLLAFFGVDRLNHPDTNTMRSDIAELKQQVSRGTQVADPQWRSIAAISQIVHLILYGQSLANGTFGIPIITPLINGAAKFVGGARPQDAGTTVPAQYGSLVTYGETVSPDITIGETPMGGCIQMIMQLLDQFDGVSLADLGQTILGSVPAEGGKNISQLSPGTTYFTRVLDNITYGKARSDEYPESYGVSAMLWAQGEADYRDNTARDVYVSRVNAMIAAAQAQAVSVTGLNIPLPFITYQTSTHLHYSRTVPLIALAQLDLCAQDYVLLATPTYFLPFYTDGLHLVSRGYKHLGAYFGWRVWQWLFHQQKPQVLMPDPANATRYGNTVNLPFTLGAGLKLVLDTGTIGNPGNYGFSAVNSSGAGMTVTDVSLVGNRVQIRFSTSAPSGMKIRYAWIGDSNKGVGNLRDNNGDFLIFDPENLVLPMHNWAPIFEVEIS